ncbi:CheR family methyltransferase [Carboxylicivirga sp. RSCT41]|uniref:CheR family methyltransferase n=1 Tax=Carboxylicivirga agarovorans TaxID=3417570 RepID=UPI003D35192B
MALGFNISELRVLSEQLSDQLNLPFRHMTHSFFKRRLSQFIEMHGIRKAEHLLEQLNNEEFADEFRHFFSVETTELFRDAGFWRHLRKIINDYYSGVDFRIWFPDVASGEELYSLLILLKELNCHTKAHIIINNTSDIGCGKIKNGQLSSKKMDINAYNYKRFEGIGSIEDYFRETDEGLKFDLSLLDQVQIKKGGIEETPGQPCDLIIIRNSMLYYAKDYHQVVKEVVDNSLVSGGFLCLGVKEQLAAPYDNRFECIDAKEKIYNKFKFLRD